MNDTPERDVVERLVEQLNICADDPMWADHCEMSKATVRRAADTITSLRAQLRDARAKAFEEAVGIAAKYGEHMRSMAAKSFCPEAAEIHEAQAGAASVIEAILLKETESIRSRTQQQIGAETK